MTVADLPNRGPTQQRPELVPSFAAQPAAVNQERLPGVFQLLLAIYVIFTGTMPTIIQGLAFGVQAGAGTEFTAAMATGVASNLLLLLPILVLANHPLGILHPLLLAVVVLPTLIHIPNVIQDWGGWTGVLAGLQVQAPYFMGIPNKSPSVLWMAVTKYNGLLILGMLSTYAGFWLYRARPKAPRPGVALGNLPGVRAVMILLLTASLLVLFYFIRSRGGVDEHLTSLGRGRFIELSGSGVVMVLTDLGAIALYIWIAARPGDIKTPLFLAFLAIEIAAQFISNGSRGAAMIVPLNIGLIWALRRRRIPWKSAALLVPIMFLSIGLLGAIRTSSWYGSAAGETAFNTSWSRSVALAQEEVAARRYASASVPVVERGQEVTGGPLFGQTYAAVFTAFIPRPLWPDKPRGAGQYYARVFLGASFRGTSIPVSPQAEIYWNFGIPGVILLSLVYGVLVRAIYNFVWRRYPNPFVIVFYVLFLGLFHFSSDRLVPLEQSVALLFFCYVVATILLPRANYAGELPIPRPSTLPSRVLSDQRT